MAERRKKRDVTRELVLQTAVAIADRLGLEGLSIRAVARDLGVTPMALYRHVADRKDLEEMVVLHLLNDILKPVKVTARTRWETVVRAAAHEIKQAQNHHPILLRVLARFPSHPNNLRLAEQVYGAFNQAGLPLEDQGLAFLLLTNYVAGAALVEQQQGEALRADMPTQFDRAGTETMLLYAQEFPQTMAAARQLRRAAANPFDHCIGLFIEFIRERAARAKCAG